MAYGSTNIGSGVVKGFNKIFTGENELNNPIHGDIWIREEIIINKVIYKPYDVEGIEDGTLHIVIADIPLQVYEKYFINIMNRSNKYSIYNYIKAVRYKKGDFYNTVASKIFLNGKWEYLSGSWGGEEDIIMVDSKSVSGSTHYFLQKFDRDGIIKQTQELSSSYEYYLKSVDALGNIYARRKSGINDKVSYLSKEFKELHTVNVDTTSPIDSKLPMVATQVNGEVICNYPLTSSSGTGVSRLEYITGSVKWFNTELLERIIRIEVFRDDFVAVMTNTKLITIDAKTGITIRSIDKDRVNESHNRISIDRLGYIYLSTASVSSDNRVIKIQKYDRELNLILEKTFTNDIIQLHSYGELYIFIDEYSNNIVLVSDRIITLDSITLSILSNYPNPFPGGDNTVYAYSHSIQYTSSGNFYILGITKPSGTYKTSLNYVDNFGNIIWSITTIYRNQYPCLLAKGKPNIFDY